MYTNYHISSHISGYATVAVTIRWENVCKGCIEKLNFRRSVEAAKWV